MHDRIRLQAEIIQSALDKCPLKFERIVDEDSQVTWEYRDEDSKNGKEGECVIIDIRPNHTKVQILEFSANNIANMIRGL